MSGKSQVDGDGFERQERAISAYCAENGLSVKKVWREKVTGMLEGMDRPAWVEMVGAMLANGVKTVVVEKLDRLSRQLGLQEYMLYDLKQRGITLLSVAEADLDTEDPTRVLFRQLVGGIAQYEKTMIVLKLRGARQRKKAATSRCEGAKPYGELPGEAEVLIRARALKAGGVSPAKIADSLNTLGIAPRRGIKWHPHAIARILSRVST